MEQAELAALHQFARREAALLENTMRADLDDALAGCDGFLREVLEYALLQGGKRIRPLLTLLSSRVCGRDDQDVYRLATAFEYLHVATLVHDDVIDNAAQRRGVDSVVSKYGLPAAILAGDWLHARSMSLVGKFTGTPGLEVFCRSTLGMVDGEFLQLRFVADPEVTEKQYFSVIHRKTALLIGSTCEIGGLMGGGGTTQLQALARYGDRLGTAFQVVDDLLDYQGNSAATGKAMGNDFIEGKMTLPLIRAFSQAGNSSREKLEMLFTGDRNSPGSFDQFVELVGEAGGFQSARETAAQLVREAVKCLQVFADCAEQESLSMLRLLAAYVLERRK